MNLKIKMFGAEWCPDCRRTKTFLEQNQIDFEYVNVDLNQEASQLVEKINNGKRIIPTLLINEKSFTNPQNFEIAAELGINDGKKLVLYGADWCPDCRRAKRFLTDNNIHLRFVDVDSNPEAADWVTKINNGKRIIPTITINEKPFTNPSNDTLTEALSLDKVSDDRIYDTIIVGGGAAGLTTAIYAQRDKYDSLILERKNIGGNAFITKKIENYPGFKEVSGPDLMDKMAEQAETLGAKIELGEDLKKITRKAEHFEIKTSSKTFLGKTIVLATGSTYRTLGIPGEKELIGAGVHFCATCDGAFYRDKELIIIGGGNSALEEGMFLASFVKKVTIIHRGDEFSATSTYVDKLSSFDNISFHLSTEPQKFNASENGVFESLSVLKDGKTFDIGADGVFIFIGLIPNTEVFEGFINLSDNGQILTKGLNETSMGGVFAAGDCRKGAIAQVAAATGEGVVASYGLREYLTNRT
ncbi:FAD-dependent oxidoreductase [Arcticibacterium luteifluviistationis]|uniref:Pyridine nucleotide-disulfide oxidoreductase n=1 Tax=Arcticibacterium luteifluviistationis TaxID=1784714 RepID=A0A2Z4GB06_9BACT|nr:FAD-dependent oxidoreductase [Arcticibacterium luteifluviistationis]AWV98462.1 pyridine nucleotide-disulfide oxidoreductase [Arcticibacterium luteifluviistationis]